MIGDAKCKQEWGDISRGIQTGIVLVIEQRSRQGTVSRDG